MNNPGLRLDDIGACATSRSQRQGKTDDGGSRQGM